MSRGGTAHELGDRLLQIYDEVKAHPFRERHGYDVCESVSHVLLDTADGMDVVSFSLDARRGGTPSGALTSSSAAWTGGCEVRGWACSTSMDDCNWGIAVTSALAALAVVLLTFTPPGTDQVSPLFSFDVCSRFVYSGYVQFISLFT
jgi:hypothetical protein